MEMTINPGAGQPVNASDLVDVPKSITVYYEDRRILILRNNVSSFLKTVVTPFD